MSEKKALVVVSFGSTVSSAQKELQEVERTIGEWYPECELFRAFSSNFVRSKLKERGVMVASVEELLGSLKQQGYHEVHVQPTFIIPGHEYEKTKEKVAEWKDEFEHLSYGEALLQDAEHLTAVSQKLHEIYPCQDGALLLFGHGTDHVSNYSYPALQTAFRIQGVRNAYVATVEGWPSLADAVVQMKSDGITKVCLVPLMLCAGEHVQSDMAGDSDNSWLNILRKNGFSVEYFSQGLGQNREMLSLLAGE